MAVLNIGRNLIELSDCKSCHQYDTTSIGPSYEAVSERYPNTQANVELLVGKVINGGSGVWGEHGMSAHPQLSEADAKRMVEYILSMDEVQPTVSSLSLEGKIYPEIPEGDDGDGGFLLRAYYLDKGAGNIPSLAGEDFVALRNHFINPQLSEVRKGVQLLTTPSVNFFMVGDQSYIGFSNIDMTGIKEIMLYLGISARNNAKGASVEIRIDSPTGQIIGQTEMVKEAPNGGFRPPAGVSRTEWMRQNSAKPSATLSEVSGRHDIYFIFKNADAKSEEILVSVNEIEFKN
jgi:cytochrome c